MIDGRWNDSIIIYGINEMITHYDHIFMHDKNWGEF